MLYKKTILLYLLFFFISSLDASYIHALKHFNRMINNKIDGINGNEVDSTKVIKFYINNIKDHVTNKKAKEEDITPYYPILEILGSYQDLITDEQAFPIRQFHRNTDDEKVDFFLEQICDIYIPHGYLLRETFSFNMLWYVGTYKLSSICVEKLEKENAELKKEIINLKNIKDTSNLKGEYDKLIETNTFLQGQLKERDTALQETENKMHTLKRNYDDTLKNKDKSIHHLKSKITQIKSQIPSEESNNEQITSLNTQIQYLKKNNSIFFWLTALFFCSTCYFAYKSIK